MASETADQTMTEAVQPPLAPTTEQVEESKTDNLEMTILSMTGDSFTLTRGEGKHMNVLKDFIDDLEEEDDDEDSEPFPLPNIPTEFLVKVLEFVKHHHQNPMPEIQKPLPSNNLGEALSGDNGWYIDFIDQFDLEQLFAMCNHANYIDCSPLLNLCCAKVASLVKGKKPEEIKETFKITSSVTSPPDPELA